MPTKRQILLGELDAWRREGVLDEATHVLLRSRYENAPRSDELDADAIHGPGPRRGADAETIEGGSKRSFAADSMQFVGGLLLGAGLVALLVFLDVGSESAPYVLLGLGALMVVPAMVGAMRGAPSGLVEAGLSGGLVPILVGVGTAIDASRQPGDFGATTEVLVPLLVALLTIGILVLRKGEGPTTLVAGGGFVFAVAAATLLREDFLFGDPTMATRWTWFLAQLGLAGLLAMWRGKLWTEISLAALVIPATMAFVLLLEPLSLEALGYELVIAIWLAPILAGGIFLGSRGLVTGAAAGLTIDAVAFAFEIGGPGTAVVVLLALGGLLVWQAENVRRYFRRGRSSSGE